MELEVHTQNPLKDPQLDFLWNVNKIKYVKQNIKSRVPQLERWKEACLYFADSLL